MWILVGRGVGERGFLRGRGDPDLDRDFEGFFSLGFFSRL